jgi:hypothetical protein
VYKESSIVHKADERIYNLLLLDVEVLTAVGMESIVFWDIAPCPE